MSVKVTLHDVMWKQTMLHPHWFISTASIGACAIVALSKDLSEWYAGEID